MLVKLYGGEPTGPETRYSPAPLHRHRGQEAQRRARPGAYLSVLRGAPEPDHADGDAPVHRLTNAFSKKVDNLMAAVSLHFMHYNYARPHQTLTKRYGTPTTPAMAAGLAYHVWTLTEIAGLLDVKPENDLQSN